MDDHLNHHSENDDNVDSNSAGLEGLESQLRLSSSTDDQSGDIAESPLAVNEIQGEGQEARLEKEVWQASDAQGEHGATFKDHARRLALVGLTSTMLLASSFMLSSDDLQQSDSGALHWDGDTYQSQEVNLSDKGFDEQKNAVVMPEDVKQEANIAQNEQPLSRSNLDVGQPIEAQQQQVVETPDRWWADVPNFDQKSLKYQGKTNYYGCSAASADMVVDYWHQQDPNNADTSAQALLDANAAQGEFTGKGMQITDLQDELDSLGYQSEVYTDAKPEELKNAVKQEPVVVVVRMSMGETGYPHAMVVTGISDQDKVRVNDPWTGRSHTYDWEQFNRSWGSFKDPGVANRSFMSIHPM